MDCKRSFAGIPEQTETKRTMLVSEMKSIYRNKKWLAAVGQIEQCVLCGKWGTQVAHRNEGKGTGLKADDCATAALCPECHHEIDNGSHLEKEERRRLIDRAIVLTVIQIARRGLVIPQ